MSVNPYRSGVNQAPLSGTDYPFAGNGGDHSAAICDLQVPYDPAVHKLPLRVQYLGGFGTLAATASLPTHIADMVIVDADEAVVVDTRTGDLTNHSSWSSRFRVYTWLVAGRYYRAVAANDNAADLPRAFELPADQGKLDGRVCLAASPQLRVEVYNQQAASPVLTLAAGDLLRVKQGTAVKATHDAAAGDNEILLSGLIDAEALRAAYCADTVQERLVRQVNEERADEAGNFNFSGDTCFRFEPVLESDGEGGWRIARGKLIVSDDCQPCCSCDDYLPIYQSLSRQSRRWSRVSEEIATNATAYAAANAIVTSKVACQQQNFLRVSAVAGDNCSLTLQVLLANPTDAEVSEVHLAVDLTYVADGQPVNILHAPRRVLISRQRAPLESQQLQLGGNDGQQMTVNLGCVPPKESKTASWAIAYEAPGEIQVCVRPVHFVAADPSLPSPPTACKRVTLVCEDNPYLS